MKRSRRLTALSALSVLATTAAGCAATGGGGSGSSASGPGAKPTKINLGVYCGKNCQSGLQLQKPQSQVHCRVAFLDDATSFPYGAAQFRLAKSYARKYFPNMDLKVFNGNNDPTTQSSQLKTVVTQGYQVVILDPVVADALVPATKRAVDQGVKVVDIDRTVNTPVLTTIKAPDVPLGERAAKHIVDKLGGHGTVAILSGTPGASPTIDRTTGFKKVIKKNPGIHIVANVNGDYDTNTAYTEVKNLLTRFPSGKLDWIFSEADVMSLGAIKAMNASGRTDVKISGIDGQQQGFNAIQRGDYESTVVYPVVMPEGLVAAAKACAGEKMPKHIPLLYPLVTKKNVDKYLGTNFG